MDGIHVLRKRKNTRLWYREIPVQSQRSIIPEDSAVVPDEDPTSDEAWERLFTDLSDEASAETSDVEIPPLPAAPTHVDIPAPAPVSETKSALPALVEQFGEDWRTVPNSAPSIL